MGTFEVVAQHEPGVTLEWLARRCLDVAEDPGNARFTVAPGEDLERPCVGARQHVGFLIAGETIDGRPVEAHAFFEGRLEVGRGDGEGLEKPEDVGEPQSDEADAPLLNRPKDVLFLLLHGAAPPGRRHGTPRPQRRIPRRPG